MATSGRRNAYYSARNLFSTHCRFSHLDRGIIELRLVKSTSCAEFFSSVGALRGHDTESL